MGGRTNKSKYARSCMLVFLLITLFCLFLISVLSFHYPYIHTNAYMPLFLQNCFCHFDLDELISLDLPHIFFHLFIFFFLKWVYLNVLTNERNAIWSIELLWALQIFHPMRCQIRLSSCDADQGCKHVWKAKEAPFISTRKAGFISMFCLL